MIRRSFLKMLLASPLLGFLKKPDKNIQEYPLGTRRENGDVYVKWAKPIREELLGTISVLDDNPSLTVPVGERWEITRTERDYDKYYIYGYITNDGGS